jgi:hypothetical protein
MITPNIIDAIKVQFIQPLFEDDFPERGMQAWLTKIEWEQYSECYKLFFDFSEFEQDNDKYFVEVYYPNRNTPNETGKDLFNAKEAGYYTSKYSVYFSITGSKEDAKVFEEEIKQYLRVVE